MELSIAKKGGRSPSTIKPCMNSEKKEGKYTSKNSEEESICVMVAPAKNFTYKPKKKEFMKDKPKNKVLDQGKMRRAGTLKELQEKVYPFPYSDLSDMLDDLLENKVINIPEMKRHEQVQQVKDPKYCKYHRLVGIPIKKCFILKEKIIDLSRKEVINLKVDVSTSYLTTFEGESSENPTISVCPIKFGDFDLIEVKAMRPFPVPYAHRKQNKKQIVGNTL